MHTPSKRRLWPLVVTSSFLVLLLSCSSAAMPTTSATQTPTPSLSLGTTRFITYLGHAKVVATEAVYALTQSPDGTRIASGGDDQTAQVWNATTGKTLLTYHGHTDSIWGLSWSPDGTRVVSSSGNQADASKIETAQVWDATTGRLLVTYRGHLSSVPAVAWSPDGKRIISASADGSVQVWQAP
jgi:WD40 repeat protein